MRKNQLFRRAICERQCVRRVPVGAMVVGRDGDIVPALLKHRRRKRQLRGVFYNRRLHGGIVQCGVQSERCGV